LDCLGNARSKGVDCVQLVQQRTWDGNSKNTSEQSKHEELLGLGNLEEYDGTCEQEEEVELPSAGYGPGCRTTKREAGSPPLFRSLEKVKKKATWPHRCRSGRTVIRTRTNERRKNWTVFGNARSKEIDQYDGTCEQEEIELP